MTQVRHRVSRGSFAALAALAMLVALVPPPAAEAVQVPSAEEQMVARINDERRAAGLGAVQSVLDVRDVAYDWAVTMADERRMYHNPSYYEQFCCWQRAAENVGWTTISDPDDPAQVSAAVDRLHTAFMNSDGHRENIMRPAYDHIGVGVEVRRNSCPDGVAIRHCMWVTENFRQWNGTAPAGGLQDPYGAGSRDPSADGSGAGTIVSDTVFPGGFDGDVETVERLGRTTDSAIHVSRARFGDGRATHAVLSRDDRFPDSLAGAPLTADGPLLFTPTAGLAGAVRTELSRVLPAGSTVYLLGGTVALSAAVEQAVTAAGFRTVRLAGPDRVATALEIADEVRRLYGDTGTVAVARASGPGTDPDGPAGWVDSITGGAWATRRGTPVVISPGDRLPTAVSRWLADDRPATTVLFGGPAALSDQVLQAVPNGARIWGQDRAATAGAVARKLWGVSPSSADRDFVLVDGWSRTGWRDGLAAAGLSADAGAPVLLADGRGPAQPTATTGLVGSCTTATVDLLMVGPLSDAVAGTLEALDGRTC